MEICHAPWRPWSASQEMDCDELWVFSSLKCKICFTVVHMCPIPPSQGFNISGNKKQKSINIIYFCIFFNNDASGKVKWAFSWTSFSKNIFPCPIQCWTQVLAPKHSFSQLKGIAGCSTIFAVLSGHPVTFEGWLYQTVFHLGAFLAPYS